MINKRISGILAQSARRITEAEADVQTSKIALYNTVIDDMHERLDAIAESAVTCDFDLDDILIVGMTKTEVKNEVSGSTNDIGRVQMDELFDRLDEVETHLKHVVSRVSDKCILKH